jgi:predicted nuclease with TOPRIM domain
MEKDIKEKFKKIDGQFIEIKNEFSKVHDRFAKVDREFVKINDRFAKIDQEFIKVHDKFAKVDQEFIKVNEKIDTLTRSVLVMENNVVDIKRIFKDIWSVANEKLSRTELLCEDHEERIKTLEFCYKNLTGKK